MKDYSRKHYTDYQYNDWLRSTPSKAIWNSILSQNTGYGEYSLNKSNKSSLSRAIASYLKQSEKKKPYRDRGFIQMEDDWEGPPGFPSDPQDQRKYDNIWSFPEFGPWTVIFDLISTSCWCKEEEREFEVSGTHPIYSLGISLQEAGTGIIIDAGIGTNTVSGRIIAGPEEVGDVNFTGSMRTSTGISGTSNYLMAECRDCEECEGVDPLTPGSNPETIAQSGQETIQVIDGQENFHWSVSGSGFSMDEAETVGRSNTLIAGPDACGTATITVTDNCNDSIEIQVRSLSDSAWILKTTTCVSPGAATEGDAETRVVGGQKQWQDYHGSGGGGCFFFAAGYDDACDDPCSASWSPITECIIFDCPALTGNPAAFKASAAGCCNVPCSSGGFNGTNCAHYSGSGGVKYYEWECI
jgi:hypothetical protein